MELFEYKSVPKAQYWQLQILSKQERCEEKSQANSSNLWWWLVQESILGVLRLALPEGLAQ